MAINTTHMCDLCLVNILIHYTVYSVRNVTDEKLCFYLPVFMHFFNNWKKWVGTQQVGEKNAEILKKKEKKSKMHHGNGKNKYAILVSIISCFNDTLLLHLFVLSSAMEKKDHQLFLN